VTDRTLWHGRFERPPADELLAYTASLPFDRRLWRQDVRGSEAHVRGLGWAGLLSADEVDAVLAALADVAAELADDRFAFVATDEDIHTAVERRVTELAGPAGARLHTGRSRNDQVATDLRLWCKDELPAVAARIVELQRVLLDRAVEAGEIYLPGYTHLQRAQPVLLAHHLLAHGWALARDVDRLLATVERLDVSPLGAGALAGSSLPLDPASTAADLGFAAVFENSLDAVSDRDFVAEALFDLALVAIHLSRMGEEWVLWTSDEVGFARLDDAYATGSSMLPQKKNPDIAELARGRAGRVIGGLTGLLVTLKGLPLAYNRDLQEDKEPLFDAVDQVTLALGALTGMIATAMFAPERMQEAADTPTVAATDLAEWLVERGLPFRDAHAVVGTLVRRSLAGEGTLADLVAGHPELGSDAAALVAPGVAVRRRTTPGGAGPGPVGVQRQRFAAALENERARVDAHSRAPVAAPPTSQKAASEPNPARPAPPARRSSTGGIAERSE
jgi:argininosuccinate lyase